MPKLLHQQVSFNAGEISPRLYGRFDLQEYNTGLKQATNVELMLEGALKKRNGTQYLAEVGDSSRKARLLPFKFSQESSVVLEFGHQTIRFFSNKAQIESGGSALEISSPYGEDDLINIVYTQFGPNLYITCEGYAPRKLTRTSSTEWSLSPLSDNELSGIFGSDMVFKFPGTLTLSSGDPEVEGNSVVYTYAGPTPNPLGRDHVNMSLQLVGEVSGRAIITARSATSITMTITTPFSSTGPFNNSDYQIEAAAFNTSPNPSGTSGSITIAAGAQAAQLGSADIGKTMVINDGKVIITGFSSNDYTANVIEPLSSSDADPNAYFLQNENSISYPQVVGVFDQRLVFGNTNQDPQSVWYSQFQDFSDFTQGVSSNDGFRVDVGYGEFSEITWFSGNVDMLVGTALVEGSVRGREGVLTPTTAETVHRSAVGSPRQVPAKVDNETVFLSGTDRVYSIRFSFEINSYVTQDLTRYAEHLTDPGLKEMTYAQRPNRTLYVVTDDGDLLAGTFSREQQVIGWSKYSTTGSYESVISVREGTEDQVYVVVNRTINGATKRYIEVFDQDLTSTGAKEYQDSYLKYSGAATNTLTGLDHLEGETVQVKIDDGTHTDEVVSGGSITLDTSVTGATVGLKYTMTAETLDIIKGIGGAATAGQIQSWVEPILQVYNSVYPTVNGQARYIRKADISNMDEGPNLATGYIKYSDVDSPTLTITDSNPLPVFINSITGEVEVNV